MSDMFGNDISVEEARGIIQARASVTDAEVVDRAFEAILDELARLNGIAKLAREVREAQRNYFRNRNDTAALQTAKGLERKLDAALKE